MKYTWLFTSYCLLALVGCTTLKPVAKEHGGGDFIEVRARGTFQSDGACTAQLFWRLEQLNSNSEWLEVFTTPCCMTCGLPEVTYRNDTVSLILLQQEASDFLISELLTPGTYRLVANKQFSKSRRQVTTRPFEVTDSVWIWR